MIVIIDCGTEWLEDIKKNVSDFNHTFEVVKIDKIENINFELFDGIIISGSSTLLSKVNLEEYLQPFQFIKNIKVPLLGICLGHQILGLLYGANIYNSELVDKMEKIKIVKQNNLFFNIEDNSLFREEHSEYIPLPQEFELLAKSETCNNEAMKHNSRLIYSTQFHPEVSKDNGKLIFGNFLEMCSRN